MTARKRRRIAFVLALLLGGAAAAALTVTALKDNVLYFYSPSDVAAKHPAPGTAFRIGGLVEPGSVQKANGTIGFAVTDGKAAVKVFYRGATPALFAEGQGVVAAGRLDASGRFVADQVLARHDEKYMPPEVADALKRAGRWKEGENGAPVRSK
jgi:cytochrome c-type biogenesis protein CcmE